jgi:hypothetical protein
MHEFTGMSVHMSAHILSDIYAQCDVGAIDEERRSKQGNTACVPTCPVRVFIEKEKRKLGWG